MILRKWNYESEKYETYEVPDSWNITTCCPDMDEIINCAQCGRKLPFGYGYTSREVQNNIGFGYAVCKDCHDVEVNRELVYLNWKKEDN